MNSPESGGSNQSQVAKLYEAVANEPESIETLMRRGGELDFSVTNIASRLGTNETISEDEIMCTLSAVAEILPKLKEAKTHTDQSEELAILDSQIKLFEAFQKEYSEKMI